MDTLDALRSSVEARHALDVVIGQQVRTCRAAGISWNEIAEVTGISKPTLMKKWGDQQEMTATISERAAEWDLQPGEVLRRREVHNRFGGSRMSGIAPSRTSENVLLFSGPAGEQFGYLDHENADGSYCYYGEGQRSHQTMTRGNLAIQNHAEQRKALRLFRSLGDAKVEYLGEYIYDTHRVVQGRDVTGQQRDLIEFTLRPV